MGRKKSNGPLRKVEEYNAGLDPNRELKRMVVTYSNNSVCLQVFVAALALTLIALPIVEGANVSVVPTKPQGDNSVGKRRAYYPGVEHTNNGGSSGFSVAPAHRDVRLPRLEPSAVTYVIGTEDALDIGQYENPRDINLEHCYDTPLCIQDWKNHLNTKTKPHELWGAITHFSKYQKTHKLVKELITFAVNRLKQFTAKQLKGDSLNLGNKKNIEVINNIENPVDKAVLLRMMEEVKKIPMNYGKRTRGDAGRDQLPSVVKHKEL